MKGGWDSVWTVTPIDLKYHPMKQLTLENAALGLFDPAGAKVVARQQLEPVYHRNGVAYVMTRDCILEQRTILRRCASAIVAEGPSVSIYTERDFEIVERVLLASEQ